ncbi:ABC transporter transmembrane domain-containing protein [Bacillus velezensis]|uniref:ABC transporter transmembrane domain-containing protein n=1 Tax=Bacillus velezensis TaxID=492670 RepID=UPI0034A5C94A
MPLFMKHVIDEIMIPKNSSLSITVFISIISFLLAYMLITFARSRVLVRLHNALDYEMQTSFFSHLLKLPLPFFLLRSYGDMLFRMNSCHNPKSALRHSDYRYIGWLHVICIVWLYVVHISIACDGCIFAGKHKYFVGHFH